MEKNDQSTFWVIINILALIMAIASLLVAFSSCTKPEPCIERDSSFDLTYEDTLRYSVADTSYVEYVKWDMYFRDGDTTALDMYHIRENQTTGARVIIENISEPWPSVYEVFSLWGGGERTIYIKQRLPDGTYHRYIQEFRALDCDVLEEINPPYKQFK